MKKYIIYTQADKIKKAILDENLYKRYKANPEIHSIQEFDNETLMEQAYCQQQGTVKNKKVLLD